MQANSLQGITMEENNQKVDDKKVTKLQTLLAFVKKVTNIVNVLVGLVMILYYILTIVTHPEGGFMLVLNYIMLVLLILNLVVGQIIEKTVKHNKNVKKIASRTFRYSKKVVKFLATGFAVFEILISSPSREKLVSAGVMVGGVLLQILLEIVIILIERAVKIAIEKAKQGIEKIKLTTKNIKSKISSFIHFGKKEDIEVEEIDSEQK